MPFTVTLMPDEPIVIVRIEVPLEQHIASATSVNAQLSQIVSKSSETIFVLIDLREQAPSFSDILIGMELLSQSESWIGLRGAHPILVGTDEMLRIAAKRFKQQLGSELTVFQTMEEALTHVRAKIAKPQPPDDE